MIKTKHNILEKDIYNIDKNGYIMDIGRSSKVVFLKYRKQIFIKQAENQEWASLKKTIKISG